MNLSDGLRAYRPRVEEILTWMPDWIDQHEFDKLARSHRAPVMPYEHCSYILD